MKFRLLLLSGLSLAALVMGSGTWQPGSSVAEEPHGALRLDASPGDNAADSVGTVDTTAEVIDGTANDGVPEIFIDMVLGDSGSSDGTGAASGIPLGTAESGTQCDNNTDDDADSAINDGCPASGPAEIRAACDNDTDDDSDGLVNDGCRTSSAVDVAGWQARIIFDPEVLTLVGFQVADCTGFGLTPEYFMEKADPCTQSVNDHILVINPPAAPGIGTFDLGSTVLTTPPGANGVGLLVTLQFDAAGSGGTCVEIGDSFNSFYADINMVNHTYISHNSITLGVNGGTAPASCGQTPTPEPPGSSAEGTPTPARTAGALPDTGSLDGPQGSSATAPAILAGLGVVLFLTAGGGWYLHKRRNSHLEMGVWKE